MNIQENISLKPYNTFGIDVNAQFFLEISSVQELQEALGLQNFPQKFIISGGSNMLLTKDIDALVLYINIKGIEIIHEDEDVVTLRIMAGEDWHQMVLWTLHHGYGGLENMSLIPGKTGTAPIQNIGAYGVELKDVFESCEAMEIESGSIKKFSREDCKFGYRDSFFKNEGRGKYVIVSVCFTLTKKNHNLNTSYGAIEAELERQKIDRPTIKDVSNAVITIRQSKLPDPAEIGNSGSFFKNPIVSSSEFDTFITSYPNAPYYKVSNESYKIPAGWLIEKCGFKGKRYGDAGVHKNQALVLVNYEKASGKEILDLANIIIARVKEVFGIQIIPEVNIIK
ncbi:UDP-N-acetylmuramate dehydrogenase [Costertonia aggregata]|uniref:UDP-N-acetylenolpyruvoylglucosamine reductase n=1 Tax=Costertonia aggregata TaxID=343403 RepID=A0A7H9ALN3_9FLAO|nr:UDP-N-acetylmuramate dehydrogenase [Costertonia aggregata]QLG44293.1 UDP-N-acetylmuramate dehydrogenase [Costertonia aggregata]